MLCKGPLSASECLQSWFLSVSQPSSLSMWGTRVRHLECPAGYSKLWWASLGTGLDTHGYIFRRYFKNLSFWDLTLQLSHSKGCFCFQSVCYILYFLKTIISSVLILTAFVPDMLPMQLREVTRVPNPTADGDGSFTVLSGVRWNPGGTETRGWASVLIAARSEGDAGRHTLQGAYIWIFL